jgi:hypothetical protein
MFDYVLRRAKALRSFNLEFIGQWKYEPMFAPIGAGRRIVADKDVVMLFTSGVIEMTPQETRVLAFALLDLAAGREQHRHGAIQWPN